MAQGLWRAMREHWSMPALEETKNTGPEWLLHLLHQCSHAEGLPVLMTLWRAWHVHNEIADNKPSPHVAASRQFLNSYIDLLLCTPSVLNYLSRKWMYLDVFLVLDTSISIHFCTLKLILKKVKMVLDSTRDFHKRAPRLPDKTNATPPRRIMDGVSTE